MHGRPSVWVESHTFCAYFFCSCGLTTLSLPSFENYWPLTLVKNWHWRSALMTRASERIVGRWSYPAVKKKFSRIWTGARQFVTSLQTQTYLYLMLRHNRFHWWVLDYLLIDCGFVRVLLQNYLRIFYNLGVETDIFTIKTVFFHEYKDHFVV